MNIDFEQALTRLANDPTDLVSWSIVLDAFSNKISSNRLINGKSLVSDIILELNSSDFENQGTTTTVLHGNAAGNPSWGNIVTDDITNANITLEKIQDIANNIILGRISGSSGIIEELTGTQVTTLLDLFATNATTKGLVIGSNNVGNTYFLRADGTWAIPLSTTHSNLTNLDYASSGHTGFEPTVVGGTSSQYYRGDKTWQTFPSGISNHNDLTGIQGGSPGNYYHLLSTIKAKVDIITDDVANTVPVGLTCSSTGISTGADGSQSAYVILTWTPVVSPTLDHYKIRYKQSTFTYYTYIDSTENSITIDGLVPNISYDFGVASVNKWGTESAYSTDIQQTTAKDLTPPATTTGLTAYGNIQQVRLEWSHNSETTIAFYNVYRKTTNDSSTSTLIGSTRGNVYVDSGLTGGQVQYYWIKPVSTSGILSVAYSSEAHATPRNVASADTNIAHRGWVQTCVFTPTPGSPGNTVTWGAGTLTSSDATTYNIDAGTTGVMAAKTYIYFNTATPTVYNVTTTATSAVGDGKVMIGIAQNHATKTEATFQIMNDSAMNIDANSIVANSITASLIEAGTISATEIDTASITNLSNLLIGAPQVTIQGAVTLESWKSYKGAYDAGISYKKGDQVLYSATYWNYVNNTPGAGHTPADDAYWDPAGSPITTIDGGNITAYTITTSHLNFTPITGGDVIASINSSAEGIKIDADNLTISGATTFDAGYDPTGRVLSVGGTYDSAAAGSRVRIFPSASIGIEVIDDAAADVFLVEVGGANVGDVTIGNWGGGQGIKYDKSAGTTTFKGSLSAGGIGGWIVNSTSIYHGTEKTTDGYSTDGITLHDDGSIHATNFYINADGTTNISGVSLPHLVRKAASGTLRHSHNAEVNSTGNYELVKTITFTNGLLGTSRIGFDTAMSGVGTSKARLYRNGVALGTDNNVTASYPTTETFAEDITQTWNPGDTLELRLYASAGVTTYASNFKVYYDDNPIVAVDAINS